MYETRNVRIGEGIPKICVPICAKNIDACVKLMDGKEIECADIIELRADWIENIENKNTLDEILKFTRKSAGEKPVIFTLRTSEEGGKFEHNAELYCDINMYVAQSGMVDIIDIEIDREKEHIESLIKNIKENGVGIIGSYHNFSCTPEVDFILEKVRCAEIYGADIAKVAVMPKIKSDTARLMLSIRKAEEISNIPIIGVSMSDVGSISRVAGGVFGSAVTFGCTDVESAPGQIRASELKKAVEYIHRVCP